MITLEQDTLTQIGQEVLDLFLIPKFIELGMNASGNWIKSLEVRDISNGFEIWGVDYTYYLVNGRSGGSMPPITPLISWVGNKLNIHGKEGIAVAWAVAKKIQKEGTDYYPSGTDLLEVLQSKEVVQYVYDKVKGNINSQAEIAIKRQLTTMLG